MLETGCNARPRVPWPGGRGAWAFAVCLTLGGVAGILPCLRADSAGDRAAQRRDLGVSLSARSTLKNDPQLRIDGLSVEVHDGVAWVKGEVPSEAMRQRALGLLQNVRGIRAVESGLRIVTPVAQEAPLLALPQEKPMHTRAGASPVRDPAPGAERDSTLPPPQSRQYTTLPPAQAAPVFPSPEAPPQRHGPTAAIPTARSAAELPPPPVTRYSVRLLPPSELAAPPAASGVGVREQIERIQQGNEHFRYLHAEVSGDTIVVQGENGAYVMEMARQLTRLPGIQHVIVKVRPAQ